VGVGGGGGLDVVDQNNFVNLFCMKNISHGFNEILSYNHILEVGGEADLYICGWAWGGGMWVSKSLL